MRRYFCVYSKFCAFFSLPLQKNKSQKNRNSIKKQEQSTGFCWRHPSSSEWYNKLLCLLRHRWTSLCVHTAFGTGQGVLLRFFSPGKNILNVPQGVSAAGHSSRISLNVTFIFKEPLWSQRHYAEALNQGYYCSLISNACACIQGSGCWNAPCLGTLEVKQSSGWRSCVPAFFLPSNLFFFKKKNRLASAEPLQAEQSRAAAVFA